MINMIIKTASLILKDLFTVCLRYKQNIRQAVHRNNVHQDKDSDQMNREDVIYIKQIHIMS